MSDSELSSDLSSAPASDDERLKLAPIFLKAKGKAVKKKKPAQPEVPVSPPRPPRSPSPPHIESIADNADIAVLVMFRSRFAAAFPPKMPHLGPQDIERGVEGDYPSPEVENLLCALLGIALNRKKPIERGHHGRALEEAIASQRAQWPRAWNGQNPISGNRSFNTMSPGERLTLLKTLVIWSLSTSEAISQTIKDSYKQSRHEDDLNQPLSVQPWGFDGDKRRYWLIEGQDDTSFRLYRESPRSQQDFTWWSIAGSIEEIKTVAETLERKDTTQAARRLASRIHSAIPRFEATEEKRRRREYRQMRRAQFSRPEPGFSLYEGRTRGKRMRYTYDDDADDSDELSLRRSGRQSDRSTPAEHQGPVVTASGRQVKARGGGLYGESLLSGQVSADNVNDYEGSELSDPIALDTRAGRISARTGGNDASRKRKHFESYNDVDAMSDEDEAASSAGWNSADNEDDAAVPDASGDDDDRLSEDDDEEESEDELSSLVVKLKVPSLRDDRAGSSGTPDMHHAIKVATPPTSGHGHPHLNGDSAPTADVGDATKMQWSPTEKQAAIGTVPQQPSTTTTEDSKMLDSDHNNPYRTPSSLASSETKISLPGPDTISAAFTSAQSSVNGVASTGHP